MLRHVLWVAIFYMTTSLLAENVDLKSQVLPFIDKYCIDCHDSDTEKGGINLENLGPVENSNFVLWKSIWEQVALKEMPPRKSKTQPDNLLRLKISNWITGKFDLHLKDKGGFLTKLSSGKVITLTMTYCLILICQN